MSSLAAGHKELVIKTNFEAARLALEKTLHTGRSGASTPALALSATLMRIAEISYKFIVEDCGLVCVEGGHWREIRFRS